MLSAYHDLAVCYITVKKASHDMSPFFVSLLKDQLSANVVTK
jgi:hypothetical protein